MSSGLGLSRDALKQVQWARTSLRIFNVRWRYVTCLSFVHSRSVACIYFDISTSRFLSVQYDLILTTPSTTATFERRSCCTSLRGSSLWPHPPHFIEANI
ncbi:hypothetical protein OUZ56_030959 [Daphnia magna]|uniref:Uncharacterized protein n=1 Tax=Daphnia magna TaxID=35525 RepID=A0ABQ9ZSS9_9CRUS|nr:hypothetical protein OUZ56_030959 [Daphnia magna]